MTQIITGFICFVIFLAAVFGWIANIFAIATSFSAMATNELILRICGVPFIPLGAVMGWF
jgi:hypothetical protein